MKTPLNTAQQEAVTYTTGPLLIVAGAGTGKTRVLTERIAYLIKSGVPREQILAITFTNKAAEEMRERVRILLQESKLNITPFFTRETPFIGTFHALGTHILREYGTRIGIKKNFSIKDRDDSLRLIKEAIKTTGLDPKQYIPSAMLAIISKQKGNLFTPEQYSQQNNTNGFFMIVARVWERYESSLKKENSLDFDDLIEKTAVLLKADADVLAQYQNRWRYIHIDEYQDTNESQYMLSRMLSEKHKNICAVGDSDQNIYSWRGASIQNILQFEKDYPNARVVLLEENYRSTRIILNAANEIIKKNKLRKEKNLFTQKTGGEKISLYAGENETDEAYATAQAAEHLLSRGVRAEDIAVLYRANFQSRALEEAFLALSIPYQIIGTRFFERKEIKDIISFIAASLNPESLSDIKRIINVPPRGVGKVTIIKIFSGARNLLPPAMRTRVESFYTLLQSIQKKSEELAPSELIRCIVKEAGIETYLKHEGDDGMERLQNIRELAALASRYDALPREDRMQKFLSDVALASDQDALNDNKKGVRLMTVHAAKGLEFQHVFIVGLEQGLFPYEREPDGETGPDELAEKQEEERRLFYVALTRAKEKLHLSFATRRTLFGASYISAPSEFFNDIPPESIEYTPRGNAEETPTIEYL